jgi:hypothetical protein
VVKLQRTIDRRATLGFIAGGMAASRLAPWSLQAAEGAAGEGDAMLPFEPRGSRQPGREVFAHWHFFAISMDNKPAASDYYASQLLASTGPDGKAADFGSYLRQRPLPRAPRPTADWAIDDLVCDIQWAQAIGIDAFLYNIITIDRKAPFWKLFFDMLEAARRVGGKFRVVPSLDAPLLQDRPVEEVAAAIVSASGHPMLLRREAGQLVLGAFQPEAWPVERWDSLLALLDREKVGIEFMPTFLNVRSAHDGHWSMADTVGEWSGNFVDGVSYVAEAAAIVRGHGKKWCAPVWPQDLRPKAGAYGEAANSRLFRDGWMNAIDGAADSVQLITWNDYSESSAIRPSTGIQYSFYDLAAFYIEWFKTAREPRITRDVLYYFHRIQPTDGAGLGAAQARQFTLQWGRGPVNDIELLAFLVEGGELQIEAGGVVHRMVADRGVTSMRVPLVAGRPRFRLKRGDRVVVEFESAYAIDDHAQFQNLLYHGGSSTRPPVARPGPVTPARD